LGEVFYAFVEIILDYLLWGVRVRLIKNKTVTIKALALFN